MLTAPTLAQIESIVHGRICAVLAERVGEVGRLSGTERLSATLGLSSLDLALLVAELEAQLGVDPFAKLVSITSVRSVDDLVRAYQQAFYPELERREDHAITAAVKRAQTRRAPQKRECWAAIIPPVLRLSASPAVFPALPIPRCFGKISVRAWN